MPNKKKKTAQADEQTHSHLLSLIPYADLTPEKIELPRRQKDIGYVRPPLSDQTFVPEKY